MIRIAGADGTIAIAGMANENKSFPVLKNEVETGYIISETDIQLIDTIQHQRQFISSAEELIGMQVKRRLQAQTPIRKTDLTRPVMVKRGASVLVLYETAGLKLTQRGIAEKAGSLGDLISLRHPNSDQLIRAVITGKNQATLQ